MWSALRHGRSIPALEAPGTFWLSGWVVPRGSMSVLEKRILPLLDFPNSRLVTILTMSSWLRRQSCPSSTSRNRTGEVQICLYSALDGDERWTSRPGRFSLGKNLIASWHFMYSLILLLLLCWIRWLLTRQFLQWQQPLYWNFKLDVIKMHTKW